MGFTTSRMILSTGVEDEKKAIEILSKEKKYTQKPTPEQIAQQQKLLRPKSGYRATAQPRGIFGAFAQGIGGLFGSLGGVLGGLFGAPQYPTMTTTMPQQPIGIVGKGRGRYGRFNAFANSSLFESNFNPKAKPSKQDLIAALEDCKTRDEVKWFYEEYVKGKMLEAEFNRPIFEDTETEPSDSMAVLVAKIKKTLEGPVAQSFDEEIEMPQATRVSSPISTPTEDVAAKPAQQLKSSIGTTSPALTSNSYTALTGKRITKDGIYGFKGTIKGAQVAALRSNFRRPTSPTTSSPYTPDQLNQMRRAAFIGKGRGRYGRALPLIAGLAENAADMYVSHRYGRRKKLINEKIDSIEDRKKILKEFDRYEEGSYNEENAPKDTDDMSVLRAKLKKVVETGKLKKRKNFLQKGWDATAATWKGTMRTVGTVLGFNQQIGDSVQQGQMNAARVNGITQNGTAVDVLADRAENIAPNGKPFEENDILYLTNNGYSREDAITLLSKDPKYNKIKQATARQAVSNPIKSQIRTQDTVKQQRPVAVSKPVAQVKGAGNDQINALLQEQKQTNQLLNAILQAIVSNGQKMAVATSNASSGSGRDSTHHGRGGSKEDIYAIAAAAGNIAGGARSSRYGAPGYMTTEQNRGKPYTPILNSLDAFSYPH